MITMDIRKRHIVESYSATFSTESAGKNQMKLFDTESAL